MYLDPVDVCTIIGASLSEPHTSESSSAIVSIYTRQMQGIVGRAFTRIKNVKELLANEAIDILQQIGDVSVRQTVDMIGKTLETLFGCFLRIPSLYVLFVTIEYKHYVMAWLVDMGFSQPSVLGLGVIALGLRPWAITSRPSTSGLIK